MEEKKENPQISQEPKVLTRSEKKKKFLLLFAGLVGFNVFVFGAFYLSFYKSDQSEKTEANKSSFLSPSPTPFPFQDMTIPYLRSRIYTSSLSELNQATETSTYIGYLTSYDSDGLKINAYLTVPKGDRPQNGWPAIVFVHGYIPPKNYQTLVNYASYVNYLAGRGFVVFKIDLRGHGDSEGEPGGGYYSSDYIIDTLNARAALISSDFVNPSAIGLWGHSMAGNVVSRALAASPEIPAVAIWAGAVYTYSDFSEFTIDDNSYQPPPSDSPSRQRRTQLFNTYCQFDPTSVFWKQVPMTNYLDGITGAISLNHAIDDVVVDIRYSRNLAEILKNASVRYELNEYPSGGHNFVGVSFNQAMQKTVDFFKKEL